MGEGHRPVPGDAAAAPGDLGAARARPRGRPRRGWRGGERAAGDGRRGEDAGRARDPRPRRQPARRRHLRPVPRRARGDPQPGPALPQEQGRAAGRRGQGRDPDPADPVRAPGHLPDPRRRHRPGRRDVLRGRPGALRRHRLPLLAAGGPRRAASHRPAGRLAAGDRLLGAARAVRPVAFPRGRRRRAGRRPRGDGRGPGGIRRGRRGRRRRGRGEPGHPAGDGPPADVRRRGVPRTTVLPAAWAGVGCWCTRAASSSRRTPTSSRPASPPRTWRESCGTAAPGVRDEPPRRTP